MGVREAMNSETKATELLQVEKIKKWLMVLEIVSGAQCECSLVRSVNPPPCRSWMEEGGGGGEYVGIAR